MGKERGGECGKRGSEGEGKRGYQNKVKETGVCLYYVWFMINITSKITIKLKFFFVLNVSVRFTPKMCNADKNTTICFNASIVISNNYQTVRIFDINEMEKACCRPIRRQQATPAAASMRVCYTQPGARDSNREHARGRTHQGMLRIDDNKTSMVNISVHMLCWCP